MSYICLNCFKWWLFSLRRWRRHVQWTIFFLGSVRHNVKCIEIRLYPCRWCGFLSKRKKNSTCVWCIFENAGKNYIYYNAFKYFVTYFHKRFQYHNNIIFLNKTEKMAIYLFDICRRINKIFSLHLKLFILLPSFNG